MPLRRVAGAMRDARSVAFAALYKRAGLPVSLRKAFETALLALHEIAPGDPEPTGAHLCRRIIGRVLSVCPELPSEEAGKLSALLRRFEVEAAIEEARQTAGALADEAALAWVLEHDPHALIDIYRPGSLRDAA